MKKGNHDHQPADITYMLACDSSDQFVSCTADAVFYRVDDRRLRKGRPASVAQSVWLQSLGNKADVYHASPEQLMILDKIPRCTSAVKPLTGIWRDVDAV